jgi:hypothetical protein
MDYFKLLRDFWDFAFENPEKISPNHCALYGFIINHSNRLGRKQKIGLPTEMAKDAIGIKSYKTYIQTLSDLIDWGFIEMLEKSKNQYSSNIIALVNFTEANTKAYDKAMLMQQLKQVQSTTQSNDSIDELKTNKEELKTNIEKSDFFISELLSDQSWCEVICMQNHINDEDLKNFLLLFKNKLKSEMDVKIGKRDFASHFSRWIPGEINKNKVIKKNKTDENFIDRMTKPTNFFC